MRNDENDTVRAPLRHALVLAVLGALAGAALVAAVASPPLSAGLTGAPPVLTVPRDMTVDATSTAGANVSFTVTATAAGDPSPVVVCAPVSGSLFAIGATSVTCKATDATGNQASGSFVVHVSAASLYTGGGGGGSSTTTVTVTTPAVTTPAPLTPAPVVVKPVVVKPVIGTPVTVPRKLVHGKVVTVSFRITRSDNGAKLTSGKMICDPSVRGKLIRHAEQFRNGVAMLRFTIPQTAKGKQLKVHLTIRLGSRLATRVSTFTVG